MRQTLEKHYGDKPVGMGGTFLVQKGKVKAHIMVSAASAVCTDRQTVACTDTVAS